jgi:hypothetical protein
LTFHSYRWSFSSKLPQIKSQRKTREVQSCPSIGHRPTVRNRPATPCSPSDFASEIDYSSSSATPKFTTGSHPSSSAQIGEASQRAAERSSGRSIWSQSSPPVPPEESIWRRRPRSRSPRTATSAAAPSPPSAAAYASAPSHIRVHTSFVWLL